MAGKGLFLILGVIVIAAIAGAAIFALGSKPHQTGGPTTSLPQTSASSQNNQQQGAANGGPVKIGSYESACNLRNITQATLTSPFSPNYTIYKLQNSNITQMINVLADGTRQVSNYSAAEGAGGLSTFLVPFCGNQSILLPEASLALLGKGSNTNGQWFKYTTFVNSSSGITSYMNIKETDENGQTVLVLEIRSFNVTSLGIEHLSILKSTGTVLDHGFLALGGGSARLNQSFSQLLTYVLAQRNASNSSNYSLGNLFFGGANLTYNYTYQFGSSNGSGAPTTSYTTTMLPSGPAQNSTVYVVDANNNTLMVVNRVGSGLKITGSIPLTVVPTGSVAISPDGRYVYVPDSLNIPGDPYNAIIDIVDTSTNRVIGNITDVSVNYGANLEGVAMGPNGKYLYAADFGNESVDVINLSVNKQVKIIHTPGVNPSSITISPNGATAYAFTGSNLVSVISLASDSQIGTIGIPGNASAEGVAVSPDSKTVYVTTGDGKVVIVNAATNAVSGTITLPTASQPYGIAITPNGNTAYIADGFLITVDLSTHQVYQYYNVSAGTNIVLTPDGRSAYADGSNFGSGQLSMIDVASNKLVASVPVYNAEGIAIKT